MSHNALPTPADVVAFLGTLQVQTPTGPAAGILVPTSFDTASEVVSAISAWERRTYYRPFFQTSQTPVSITLDPPGPDQSRGIVGGSRKLLLPNGLLSVTSIVNNVDSTQVGSGSTLTQGLDFWPGPSIAPTQQPPEPYTEIVFSVLQRGLRQSIVITGVWGYCQGTVPDDAWTAIRDMAAARVLQGMGEAYKAGFTSISDVDQSVSLSPQLLLNMGGYFTKRAESTLSRYRLMN